MDKTYYIFTDGGARGNPGPAAIGFVLNDSNNKTIIKTGKYIGKATNNVAEYTAVVESLNWIINNLKKNPNDALVLKYFLDSQLVVNQLMGVYRVKDIKLKSLIIKVKYLEHSINGTIEYFHIPREKNIDADALVNQTLDNVLE